jgi:predicted DNA-binding protein
MKMITLRLDPNLEQTITNTAKNLGLTKSDLIRKSILEYLRKLEKQNAWEAGQDLFGKYSSGYHNLSSDRKEIVKDKIKAKRG